MAGGAGQLVVVSPEGYLGGICSWGLSRYEVETGCSASLIVGKLYCWITQQGRAWEIVLYKYRTPNVHRINTRAFECLQPRQPRCSPTANPHISSPAHQHNSSYLPFSVTHPITNNTAIWTEFLCFHLYVFQPKFSQYTLYIFQRSSKHLKLLPGDLLLTRFPTKFIWRTIPTHI